MAAPLDTLTRAAAEKLTTEHLARRVLGMAGASVREARVIAGDLPMLPQARLGAIEFTAGGRQGGSLGLCTATVTTVRFAPVDRNDPAPDPDSVAAAIELYPLWSVLPQAASRNPADLKAYELEQPLCAARKAVLAGGGDWFRTTWNGQRDLLPNEMVFAADLLRRLDRPSSAIGTVTRCDDAGVEGCPDAVRALSRIDMLRPARVDLDPCGGARICITAEMEWRGLQSVAGEYIRVRIETDAATLFTPDPRVLSVTLARINWVV